MINIIEIITKIPDTRALMRKRKLEANGFANKINSITLVDVYSIDKKLSIQQLKKIVSMLINPVVHEAGINKSLFPKKFTWAVETGYLPGVTDNIGNTAQESIEDLLKIKFKNEEHVYTSQITFIDGSLTKNDTEIIANSLHNPIIQQATIKNFPQFKKDKGMDRVIPKVKLDQPQTIDEIDLNISDEELTDIGKKGIKNKDGSRRGPLALSLFYLKTIQSYFKKLGRNPTDIELESIAQTWSEHCKHTIFNDPIDKIKDGLFKTYIKKATKEIRKQKGKKDICVSVFTDNSGAIEFNDKYLITHKVETHNSPSALDPFGGAITGIVGVNRDTIGFGLGAKPIINTYGFCFADPKTKSNLFRDQKLTQKLLSPRRIIDGVIEGVNVGGNCSGIPTPQGFVYFDQRYQGKPLVFVGTVGLIPKKNGQRKLHVKKTLPGDYIIMVGGRVGQDGIHGATFSSEALDTGSPAGAVQIGDPITQKKLSDAIVREARDLGLYNSITDNGAGGLSCSVAEMAKESNGCFVKLDDVPLKYPGLSPWQIWVSESQERMTLAVPKNKWREFAELMKRRGVEATIVGKFNKSGRCTVEYKGEKIMDIEMKFLHDGLPKKYLYTAILKRQEKNDSGPVKISTLDDYSQVILKMLARLNIASYEFISMQYDHEVQGGSVLKPLQGRGRVNADATVTRPILSSKKGVIISQGITPCYGDIDMYDMAAGAIDTAIRNAVASGVDIDRLALLDNFCWCSPNEPERLGQLKKATQACYDYSIAYQTPFISGKDSMYNDFKGYDEKNLPIKISIPPTLLISSISVMDDVLKSVSLDLKIPGDLIYIIGNTYDELGGSEYYAMNGFIGNYVPKVNAEKNRKVYKAFYKCIEKEIIASSISIGRGGLGIALVKTAIAGMLGIDISLRGLSGSTTRDDFALFSESQGRIIVTVDPTNKKEFEKRMKDNFFALIGKATNENNITIKDKNEKTILKIKLEEALKAYKSTFKDY